MFFLSRGLLNNYQQNLQDAFLQETHGVSLKLNERLFAYGQILRAGAGLFAVFNNIGREEWHHFIEKLDLDQTYRGIQGVGFAQIVPKNELKAHVQKMRKQGFSDYLIKPVGEREFYTSIIYLEPFSGRNLRSFGYDMYSEPVRRVAMERARDTGEVAFSGKVTLLQETQADVQAGLLAYFPIYRHGVITQTTDQRRDALLGWIFSPYRMNDLIKPIVETELIALRLEVFDGDSRSPENLLFDNHANFKFTAQTPQLQSIQTIAIGGRVWTLRYTSQPGFGVISRVQYPTFELFGQVVVMLLLLILTWVLLNTRYRAELIADKLTQSLRYSEARYNALFSLVNTVMLLIDASDGHIVEANERACLFYGYNKEHLQKLNVSDINAFDADELASEMQAARQQKRNYLLLKHRLANGELRDVEIHTGPIELDGKRLVYSIVHDVTERKLANKRIRDASQYARSLIEASLDPLVTISADGKIMDVNQAATNITGYSREQLIGSDFSNYFTDPGRARSGYQLVFAQGSVRDYPLAIHHCDGHVIDVLYNASVYRDDKGQVQGVCATARDITQHKVSEDNLRKQREDMRQMLETSPIAVLVSALNGREILFANQRYVELIDAQPGTITDLAPLNYFDDPDEYDVILQELAAGVIITNRSVKLHIPGKGSVWAMASYMPIDYLAQKAILGWFYDVTELHEAKDMAERVARLRSEFLANMSHEIRTPMNGIIGLAQLALNQPNSPEVSDYLRKIVSSSESLLGILNDILDFSKLEAGRVTIENTLFDLNLLLDNLRNLFEERAKAKQLSFEIKVDQATPAELLGDALRLQQILSNLLGNAIKFTLQGHVLLRVQLKQLLDDQAVLHFEVEDSGIGIAPDDLDKLFQSFSQIDGSITRRFGGTGLGLVISQNLLNLMGGQFAVNSVDGKGTCFGFDLHFGLNKSNKPRQAFQRLRAEAGVLQKTLQQAAPHGISVLIAEDNHINQQVANEFLTLAGMHTILAVNGLEVLEQLKTHSVDVILMDVHMPMMSGLEATRIIRANPRWADLPILALTAGVTSEEREKCLAGGMNDFIAKPVNAELLVKTIAHWVTDKTVPAPVIQNSMLRLPHFELHNVLHGLAGNETTLKRLLLQFKQDAQVQYSELKNALAQSDYVIAQPLLHKIKGAAGNLGAQKLYEVCASLESEVKNGQFTDQSLADFETEFNQVMNVIEGLKKIAARVEKQVDVELAQHVISKLDAQLAQNDFVSEAQLTKLAHALPANCMVLYDNLVQYIHSLHYSKARSVLGDINKLLG